jgi:pimeloyl-ACP methyl ester carboxylesterase
VGTGAQMLICVNGMQQTMAGWAALLRRTKATGFRTVVFDFPNQGRTSRPNRKASLTIEQQIQVLAAIVEHVSPGTPVALMGGSWGALLAAAYASMHPDRVSRLLLCSFHTRPNVKVREIARRGRSLIEEGRYDALATLFLREFGNRIPQPLRDAMMLTGDADLDAMFDLRRIKAETVVINGELDPLIDHSAVADTYFRFLNAQEDQPARLSARA